MNVWIYGPSESLYTVSISVAGVSGCIFLNVLVDCRGIAPGCRAEKEIGVGFAADCQMRSRLAAGDGDLAAGEFRPFGAALRGDGDVGVLAVRQRSAAVRDDSLGRSVSLLRFALLQAL